MISWAPKTLLLPRLGSRRSSRRRARHRRKAPILGAVAALGILLSLFQVGWTDSPRPWQQAVGWERIPAAERAPVARGWPSFGPDFTLEWLGHAGFRIRWDGTVLVIDPNLSPRCTVVPRRLLGPLNAAALEADGVLVSHAHFDHLDLPTLEAMAPPRSLVVPAGAGAYVEALAGPTTEIRELSEGDSVHLDRLRITAVPAAHNGNRLHPFHSREGAVGYVIEGPGPDGPRTLYLAGDTGFGDPSGRLFTDVRTRYRPDLAVLPIGAYAPRAVLAPYHLSPEEAVRAARLLGVEGVFPSHFGTFMLSLDRPDRALPRFAREAAKQGVPWRMPALWPGELP